MNYKQAKDVAAEKDKTLRSDDPRFCRMVTVIHEEGSVFTWRYAFFEKQDDWYFIFTEHHGTNVYHKEDLYHISQWERIE